MLTADFTLEILGKKAKLQESINILSKSKMNANQARGIVKSNHKKEIKQCLKISNILLTRNPKNTKLPRPLKALQLVQHIQQSCKYTTIWHAINYLYLNQDVFILKVGKWSRNCYLIYSKI